MITPHTKDGSTKPDRIGQTETEADEFSSQEYLGRRIRGATDGEIRSVWPIRSRIAESTSDDPKPDGRINIRRSEAGWPNQRQKPDGRTNVRRSEAASGGRQSRATGPTTGNSRTQAEVKRPGLNGRSQRAEADAGQRSSCHCPH